MIASVTDGSVVTADPALAVAVLLAVAAGFFTVAIHYYFRLTAAAERLFIRRARKRLDRSDRLLAINRYGRLLWLIDVTCVLGLRATIGIYAGIVWFLAVPLLMTWGSLMLAASLVSF